MERKATTVVALAVVPLLAAFMSAASPANAAAPQPTLELGPGSAQPSTATEGSTGATVYREGTTQTVVTEPGEAIPPPPGLSDNASPTRVARVYLRETLPKASASVDSTLAVDSAKPSTDGGSMVRFQQEIDGVPVLGAEQLVDVNAAGDIRFSVSRTLKGSPSQTEPTVSASGARGAAVADVAEFASVDEAELSGTKPKLWIYDKDLVGPDGAAKPKLVWEVVVESSDSSAVRNRVLVDAVTGRVALNVNAIETVKNRRICDAGNSPSNFPCESPVRVEGGGTSRVSDVNSAYTFSGDTYDFYWNRFGRDSLDGYGMALESTVRYCAGGACPYDNAFWNGNQMVYGLGYAVDDVVGHELTHGVTQYMSDLVYWYESGAINESLSDVFGEFIDLTNTGGNDAADVRWELGEDVPGYGTIRDLSNPTVFGDPDRMGSPYYYYGSEDNGGVHINSGVGNKLAYLLTDGEYFNGQTVTGLGITKAALIIYGAAARLVSSSQYSDYGLALRASCSALVGTSGISSADCDQVANALVAVEIGTPVAAPAPTPTATAPGPVGAIEVVKERKKRKVSWGAASSATSYQVTGTRKWRGKTYEDSADVSATTVIVKAKLKGKYTVYVTGKNSVGYGPTSSTSFRVR